MQNDSASEEITKDLAIEEKNNALIVENGTNGNGTHALLPAKKTPSPKHVSNEELIAEQKSLLERESEIERNYHGVGGYLRLFKVSKVIGMLALYLYLDQYDLHHAQHLKLAEARMQ
ncbi:MAG TPA: hypothetical protein VF692_10480, partial [Pyrinomonadaceae bacterium]